MRSRVNRARLAVLPLACAAAFPALAQSTPTLSETVVTATRFAEELSSLPMGVSVITTDDIRASGATTVNEAVMRLLGVPGRLDPYGGGNYTLDLRGFGETANSNQIVVLDGVRLNEADLGAPRLSGIPIDAIERIEVLRGSGAVLYGEGATAGVIVITTKAGIGKERKNSATVYAGAGSDRLRELRAGATVASGGFSVDVSGQRRDTDNHRDNFRSESDGGSISVQWSNDALRVGVSHSQDSVDTRLPGPLSAEEFAADPSKSNTPDDWARIRNNRQGLFAEAFWGNWQFAVDAGWRDKALRSQQGGFDYNYDVDASNYALRGRHESASDGLRNVLVLGYDHGRWTRDVLGSFGSQANQKNRAWYVRDELTLSAGTRLSAGWRTERVAKDANDATSELADRLQAWELGVSQPIDASTQVWARVGKSFRLANVDEFSYTDPSQAIRPQTSRDTEAGVRWKRGPYKLEARLYRSAITDEIGYDPQWLGSGPYDGRNINFDPTRRQGLELDGDWAVLANLNLSARLNLRRSSFRSGPYAGNDVPLTARETLTLRADWAPRSGHRVTGGVNWVGGQHPDLANQCRMPSYTTVDARYAYQWDSVELSFGVSNLLDRSYYTQAYTCSAGVATDVYPEAGRSFVAALRMSF
jgi:iron complex outermembrane receptor protein